MKKLFLLPTLFISIGAMAQNKPVEAPKPKIDTMYHLKPIDVFNRAYLLQRAALYIKSPDDISINEKKQIGKWADSLSNIDGTWYNRVKGIKP